MNAHTPVLDDAIRCRQHPYSSSIPLFSFSLSHRTVCDMLSAHPHLHHAPVTTYAYVICYAPSGFLDSFTTHASLHCTHPTALPRMYSFLHTSPCILSCTTTRPDPWRYSTGTHAPFLMPGPRSHPAVSPVQSARPFPCVCIGTTGPSPGMPPYATYEHPCCAIITT